MCSSDLGVVGPVQVRTSKKIPARESPERPLVCMRRWRLSRSASVVTIALSLTVLRAPYLLQSRLGFGHDQCSSRSVCMHGVSESVWAVRALRHILPNVQGGCLRNQSNRGIRLVTIQSKPSDRDASGPGASGPWPPARPNPPGSGMSYIPIRLHTTFATYHLRFRNTPPFLAMEGGI